MSARGAYRDPACVDTEHSRAELESVAVLLAGGIFEVRQRVLGEYSQSL